MSTDAAGTETSPHQYLTHAAATDVGLRREENQDSFGIIETPTFRIYVVADGMGGVKGGGVASSIAVQTIREHLRDRVDVTEDDLLNAIGLANERIFEAGSADPGLQGMGTTFVCLNFVGQKLFLASVGDSRAYRVRENKIVQLTEDHTLVQELLRSGAITEAQASNHPVSHMLTRSLGPTPAVEADCWLCPDGPARGDIYILCSDGLYNLVHPDEMREMVQNFKLDDAVKKLIELANERGGTDNITVVTAEVGEHFPLGPEDFPEEEPIEEQKPDATEVAEEIAAQATAEGATQNGHTNFTKVDPDEEPQLSGKVSLSNLVKEATASQDRAEAEAQTIAETAALESKAWWQHVPAWARYSTLALVVAGIGYGAGSVRASNPQPAVEPEPVFLSEKVSNPLPISGKVAPETVSTQKLAPIVALDRPNLLLPETGSVVMANRAVEGAGEMAPAIPGPTDEERDRIVKRKDTLRASLTELDNKIASFDRPLSAHAVELIQKANKRADAINSEIDSIRGDIDVATRRLAVWYGRRKRLQSGDPINLASEVAVSSSVVRQKKESFEHATWAYLKEAEVLRYNPSDRELEARVAELAKVRKERMSELSSDVQRAIDEEIGAADHLIADLTLKRDKLTSELRSVQDDVEYAKILMGSDTQSKQAKKKELERERSIAAAELAELEEIMLAR